MAVSPMLIKVAATLLTSEKGRKGVGFLLVAIFAPVILIAAILCSNTAGGADHNNLAVEASFYGVNFTDSVPAEFQTHITDMQTAFSLLDSAVAEANANMTDGNRLDPIQVKAIFYALCFGETAPSQRAADRFVDCFFITEQRTRIVVTELEDGSTVETEEVYTATVPLSLAAAYENLAAKLGRTVTDEDKENAAHIYTMIAGNANGSDGTGASGGTIQIDYGYGNGSTELDTSGFTNPVGKNAGDLVQYAIHAYEEHWGYTDWGTTRHESQIKVNMLRCIWLVSVVLLCLIYKIPIPRPQSIMIAIPAVSMSNKIISMQLDCRMWFQIVRDHIPYTCYSQIPLRRDTLRHGLPGWVSHPFGVFCLRIDADEKQRILFVYRHSRNLLYSIL